MTEDLRGVRYISQLHLHNCQVCVEYGMARLVLQVSLLLTVIKMTDGQSTSADPRCVCTVNVPTSGCGQTQGPSVDDQLLKSHVIALQAQIKQLASDVENLKKERSNCNTGRTNTLLTGSACIG